MISEYKKLLASGVSGHLCARLGDYILVYGGSSFENTYDRVVHQEYYVYTLDFELVNQGIGSLEAENGIKVQRSDGDALYYVLGKEVYRISLDGFVIQEELIATLPVALTGGFGALWGDNLICGRDRCFAVDVTTGKVWEREAFIGETRNQAVYFESQGHLYVLGGGAQVAYLDAYGYDISSDTWTQLADIPCSLLGASAFSSPDGSYLIMGGFAKEVYDKAVLDLKNPAYKKTYFAIPRDDFKWNDQLYHYNPRTHHFSSLGNDPDLRLCGSTVVEIDKSYYAVMGELKPGLRSSFVYKLNI